MVYANQTHSREFSNQKKKKKKKRIKIVCASIFKIMCPGPGWDQSNLPHTFKIMVYIHILFGHLFDNAIKMVNCFFLPQLKGTGKLKVSSYL